ncbi:MAG: hypothetical protein WCP77_01820 [Roseococcus sp.]
MKKAARDMERVWAVIGEDGRHVLIGRNTDPSDEEVARTEEALSAQGLAGWLAVVEGDRWSRRSRPTCLMVRPLASPATDFASAAAAFEERRQELLASTSETQ